MRRTCAGLTFAWIILLGCTAFAWSADGSSFTRKEDVVYGRRDGTALTLDVFTPKANANGAAIIWVVSGGWFSSHDSINPGPAGEYLKRGYTVFAVVHRSNPRFTILEAVEDMNRSVRYIRFHAAEFKIDPERIGITGGSAGGHLSLMQGTAGDTGNPKHKDPVEKTSSRVQAVACLFPPTDFLNYGTDGENAMGRGVLEGFKAPFDFREFDKNAKKFERITDENRILEIGKKISPINHVSADDPPTLIIHGDVDKLVPIQQAQIIIAKLKSVGVSAELITKAGGNHGGKGFENAQKEMADWFDKYLKVKSAE